jgi:hypothetical protein
MPPENTTPQNPSQSHVTPRPLRNLAALLLALRRRVAASPPVAPVAGKPPGSDFRQDEPLTDDGP